MVILTENSTKYFIILKKREGYRFFCFLVVFHVRYNITEKYVILGETKNSNDLNKLLNKQ
jgi:hypothetical protein